MPVLSEAEGLNTGAATGEELFTVSDEGHTQPLDAVDFTPHGHRIAAGVAFSPDGTRLATTGSDDAAKVWDAFTGQLELTLPHRDGVSAVAFSPDGTRLATLSDRSYNGEAKIWDVDTGRQVSLLPTPHRPSRLDFFQHVVFSPDGMRLSTISNEGWARIWDTATREILLELFGDVGVYGLAYAAFSPDGTRLATTSWDRTVRIRDLDTGAELLTLSGHTNAVNSVAYSRDGTRLATASTDGTARVWDAATGEELIAISTHPVGVGRALFSPDGTRLITANWDNTVRVYVLPIEELMDLARSRVTRSLTDEECRQFLHVDECPVEP